MDLHKKNKSTGNGSGFPVLTDVVQQFFHQFTQQPNNNGESSIQVTNKFATNLQDINDDCLREIFSLKVLNPMDLCSLAETCRHFKQITQPMFPKKFTESYYNCYSFRLEDIGFNLEVRRGSGDKERVFKNFGSCLSEVSMRKEDVLDLVAMYCGDNLKSLELRDINIPDVLPVKLKPIFKRLQKLVIFNVTFDTNLFADFDSLIELDVCYCDAILENTFPKLERFTFHHDSNYSLLSFLPRHKCLKTVVINMQCNTRHRMYHNPILQTIGRNSKELEELTIRICNDCNFTDLQNLGQLKKLHIYLSVRYKQCIFFIPWIHRLQSLKSLETFKLCDYVPDSFGLLPALAQLKKLRELYLFSYCGDSTDSNQFALISQLKKLRIYWLRHGIDVILNIIRVIVSLEELQLDIITDGLTKEDFSSIVNLVKGRSKILTLKCKIPSSYDSKNCDENQKVKFLPLG